MIRSLLLAGAACIAVVPLSVSATPSPSPSLDTVLAKPPTADFVPLTSGQLHGEFTAHDWATNSSGTPTQKTDTEATLNRHGFVSGYGLTWTSTSQRRALIEIVMAFTGGQGAQKVLTDLELSDRSSPHYVRADTLSGINPSYGVHAFDQLQGVYEDGFGFAKGNDVFLLAAASTRDDNLDLATSQAKAQYDSAPDSTIPSSQWPENAQSSNPGSTAGSIAAALVGVVFVLAVIGLAVGLFLRSRRRQPAFAQAYGAVATSGVQMSPDGSYWYDGQAWRDAAHEVPPAAERSSDGTLWWDGRTWRPVPQPPAA